MPLEFPPNTKFAAIHLARCPCDQLPEVQIYSNELSVHTSPVYALDYLDRERIGKDYADGFEESNLVLVASRVSATTGIMDAESQELEHRVYGMFYGVLMQGVPNFWPGVLTLGHRSGTSAPWGQRTALINDIIRHRDARYRVTAECLANADAAVPGLIEVFAKDDDAFMRVRRGINGLIQGWKGQTALGRLHSLLGL